MKKLFLGAVVAIAIVGAASASNTNTQSKSVAATYQDTVPSKDTTKKDTPPTVRPMLMLNK